MLGITLTPNNLRFYKEAMRRSAKRVGYLGSGYKVIARFRVGEEYRNFLYPEEPEEIGSGFRVDL